MNNLSKEEIKQHFARVNGRMSLYEHIALMYAERYGIYEYDVVLDIMIYKESYPTEGTVHVELDLNTGQEHRFRRPEPRH